MLLRCFCTDYQREIISSTARFLGVFMGRRAGKTFTFYFRAAYKCLSQKNFRYVYLCQINSNAEKVFKALAYNPQLKPFIATISKKTPFKIFFKNGSSIEFWNYSDPDALRGNEYEEVWALPPAI